MEFQPNPDGYLALEDFAIYMHTEIVIPVKKQFDFQSVLQSHGWVDLLPNKYDERECSFSRPLRLTSNRVVHLIVSSPNNISPDILINIEYKNKISAIDQEEIKRKSIYMLRLNENLDGFYSLCRNKGNPWKSLTQGKGYLLRSPDIFEDLVKVICTTNIQWAGTKRMVGELVEKYGSSFPMDESLKTFPSPRDISDIPLLEFKSNVHLGYRADYVYLLAKQIEDENFLTNKLLDESISTDELKNYLMSIKGIGNYAASTMLMLLGRYDHVPVDTVFRDFMKAKYFQNKPFTEEKGLQIFDAWGKWKYLAYWYEMVNHRKSGDI
jgi:3-methyladenine DNA glycosylase/8-oxoguanine DNA glycosylase